MPTSTYVKPTACTCHALSFDGAIERGTENDPNPTVTVPAHGHFSEQFFRKVLFALEHAPGVVQHVISLRSVADGETNSREAFPSLAKTQQFGDRVTATKEPPLPFNQQAWDDANHLYATLVYWSRLLAPELKLQPPTVARRAWTNARGHIIGLPANVTPDDARYSVGVMSLWLRTQLELIMNLDPDDVTEFAANIGDVFRVNARFPQRDRSTRSALRCPNCGAEGLTVYPPEVYLGHTTYYCHDCNHMMYEDEYLTQVHRLGSQKIAHHLVAKYGVQIPGEWRA